MISKAIAQSLMGIIPEKLSATVTLLPDSTAPIDVAVQGAWMKPIDVALGSYGGLNLQGDETRIKIPDHELNANRNGYEIRPLDRITIAGSRYVVLSTRLMSVKTVWECLCRKEIT